MSLNAAIGRAQAYGFFSTVFLYPLENWTEDLSTFAKILPELALEPWSLSLEPWSLSALQSEHLRVFGLTGSLCYETEYGLPHEFRQSQELADIAGFYHAFGFRLGGAVRERPDHLAAELEFMHLLALKEAYALQSGIGEHIEVCVEAQRKFLADHLGRWLGWFAEGLGRLAEDSVYTTLARLAAALAQSEAARLGVPLQPQRLVEIKATPLAPDLACGECPLLERPEKE